MAFVFDAKVLGSIFQSGLLAYYGTYLSFAHAMGQPQSGHYNLAAGLGSFGYEPNVSSVFGIPQSVTMGGAVMNIPIVADHHACSGSGRALPRD
jgi:hypothetical protein